MSVTGSIMAGVGLAGSIGGAAIGANAAGNAASTQANAANNAAELQYQESQNALGFEEQQWNQQQQNEQPWLQSGTGAISNLDYLMGIGPQQPSTYMMQGATQVPNGAAPTGISPSGTVAPTGSPVLPAARPSAAAASPVSSIYGNQGFTQSITPAPTGTVAPGTPSVGAVPGINNAAFSSGSGTVAPRANPVAGGSGSFVNPGGASGGVTFAQSSSAPATPGGYGSLMQPYGQTFQAPTAEQALNSPGEQAQLQLGEDAVQRSAAANGGVLTGGTAKDLDTFAQQLASTNYQNVYNDALNAYNTNYNVWNNDQSNQFNRLAAIAGVGQTAANQLGSEGQAASNNVSNNLLTTGSNIGQQYNNAGAANASGIIGAANAYGGAIGNTSSSLQNLLMLQQLYGSGSSSPYSDAGMGF